MTRSTPISRTSRTRSPALGAFGAPTHATISPRPIVKLFFDTSAFVKRYHPASFLVGLLNSQPMGFYAPAQIVRDAREHDVLVRAVDVNASEWDCSLQSG